MADETRRPLLSVITPAYNESAMLAKNLATLCDHLDSLSDRYQYELLVVNDGSKDDTGAIAEAFSKDRPQVRVLHHVVNMNLGQALRTGFAHATGEYVVVLDVDLSYSPDHVERMVDHLRERRAHIVVASPYMDGGQTTQVPFLRLLLSRNANRYLAWFCQQSDLHTITGMVRAYDRRFLQRLDLRSQDVEINTEIIYKAMLLRGRIEEIPAHLDWSAQRQTVGRLSSFRVLRGILTYTLGGFVFRPFAFFMLPGLLALAAATYILGWFGLHVWWEMANVTVGPDAFWDDRLSEAIRIVFEHRTHAFIVGGFCLLVGLQLMSLGVLSFQQKRYFEELFHLGSSLSPGERPPDVSPLDSLPGGRNPTPPPS
jgi:glycosyltransferase involved in cell wall biosynthesis